MKSYKAKCTRTLLFVSLVAGALGVANAGTLTVGPVSQASAQVAGAEAFSFAVSNHGSTPASDVRVMLDGLAAVTCAGTTAQGHAFALSGALAAGDSVACTGRSVATDGRSDASITVLGQSPSGTAIHHTAHATYATLGGAPPNQSSVALLLGAIANDVDTSGGQLENGDTIDYSFTVLNFGNVALENLVVTDDLGTAITCPGTTLAVDASMVCTSTYNVTATGTVINTGYVDGNSVAGAAVFADNAAIRSTAGSAEIRAWKSPMLIQDSDSNGVAGIGDIVEYTFAIKNSSGVQLNTVNLTEDDPSRIDGGITCNTTTLGGNDFSGGLNVSGLVPGDTLLCYANYTIAQIDVDNGSAGNAASVSGSPPFGGILITGSAVSLFVIPPAPPLAPSLPVPLDDWRAMLLLGLGLLAAAFAVTYRKRQRS